MLRAGCDKIGSSTVNCRMCLVARRELKKRVKIKRQNEKIVETDRDIWH